MAFGSMHHLHPLSVRYASVRREASVPSTHSVTTTNNDLPNKIDLLVWKKFTIVNICNIWYIHIYEQKKPQEGTFNYVNVKYCPYVRWNIQVSNQSGKRGVTTKFCHGYKKPSYGSGEEHESESW